jgi:hypothetical protein
MSHLMTMLNQRTIELHLSDSDFHKIERLVSSNSWIDIATVVTAVASLIAAGLAYLTIRQNAATQKALLVQSIHDKFLDINRDFALSSKNERKKLTEHDYELLANLFERVGQLVRRKEIELSEFSEFEPIILEPDMGEFVARYRQKNGIKYYSDLDWLIKEIQGDH